MKKEEETLLVIMEDKFGKETTATMRRAALKPFNKQFGFQLELEEGRKYLRTLNSIIANTNK